MERGSIGVAAPRVSFPAPVGQPRPAMSCVLFPIACRAPSALLLQQQPRLKDGRVRSSAAIGLVLQHTHAACGRGAAPPRAPRSRSLPRPQTGRRRRPSRVARPAAAPPPRWRRLRNTITAGQRSSITAGTAEPRDTRFSAQRGGRGTPSRGARQGTDEKRALRAAPCAGKEAPLNCVGASARSR